MLDIHVFHIQHRSVFIGFLFLLSCHLSVFFHLPFIFSLISPFADVEPALLMRGRGSPVISFRYPDFQFPLV